MPPFFFYVIMGIMQGILEWLPISSEGQLVFVATEFFSLTVEIAIRLAIWLHFGTLIAVVWWYRKEWILILSSEDDNEKLRELLIFSTLGTSLVSVPIRLAFSTVFESILGSIILLLMAFALFFTSYMLRISVSEEIRSLGDLNRKQLFIIGMFQGLAIIPGVSRSGTTIGAFLLMKIDKNSSLKGSFLISVPAVLGAISLEILLALLGKEDISSGLSVFGVLISIVLSFVFGIITLKVMIELVRKTNFSAVALILGILFLIIFIFTI